MTQDQPQPKSHLEQLNPRSLKYLSGYLQSLVRGRLWAQVLAGMVLGLAVGIAIGPTGGWLDPDVAATLGNWLALPGKLFLALIQMIVVPLVFASIIRGLAATENPNQLRTMGLRVVLYFVATTALAIVIGIVLALIIQPGNFVDQEMVRQTVGTATMVPV